MCFALVLPSKVLLSQTQVLKSISFNVKFGNSPVLLNDSVFSKNNGDSIQFETLKFYVSNIEFLNSNKPVWQEKNSFHLLDASVPSSMNINFKVPSHIKYNQLKFNLGIDSVTNVSGALGGDLDPTKGMYWTWQSGYVNFKLEGKSKKCKTRNNQFQFHLGGYQTPNKALQTILLSVKDIGPIQLSIDLEVFTKQIDFSKQNKIMSPSIDAVLISKKVAQSISVQ
jgi:hypothetical protein